MSLKSTGTHYAKRCEGPASQGKRVHFREGRKNLLRSVQKIVVEGPETRRAFASAKEAEREQSAGRRLRPEAVSGQRAKRMELEFRENNDNAEASHQKSAWRDAGCGWEFGSAYWTAFDPLPKSMDATTVTCCMTSSGSTRAIGWAASISF
jgi:hypothetical protein